jgi:hypothetical protein
MEAQKDYARPLLSVWTTGMLDPVGPCFFMASEITWLVDLHANPSNYPESCPENGLAAVALSNHDTCLLMQEKTFSGTLDLVHRRDNVTV